MQSTLKNPGNHDRMRLFSNVNFRGGWELWLQCEAFANIPESATYSFEREVRYNPNASGPICDFQIRKADGTGITMWIELKVLLKEDIRNLVRRFASDLWKINKLNLPEDTNSIGAIAVVPLHEQELFDEGTRQLFIEVCPDDIDLKDIEIHAIHPNPDVVTVKGRWSEPGKFRELKGYISVLFHRQY